MVNGTFPSKGQSTITIGEGGVLRVSGARVHQNGATAADIANETKYGINLVDGGMIDMHGMKGLIMENGRHGFFHIDGGTIRDSRTSSTYFPNRVSGNGSPSAARAADVPTYWANTPITIGEKGATYDNSGNASVRFYVPFKTGTAAGTPDGGLHLTGRHVVYYDADGSTYTGGLHLDSTDGLLFVPGHDSAFGAVPESPRDNIFVRGSSTALFSEQTDLHLDANRNVLVSSNRTFNVIAKTDKTLTIHGEINGEHEPGALPTTTRLMATWQWAPISSGKGGLVVLDPGEGRTNNVGRLTAEGKLEIKSGTTIVNGSGLNDAAALYVHGGTGTADDPTGKLTVSGGEIVVSPDSEGKYVQVGFYNTGNQKALYGFLDVCGGTVKTSGSEFLNAIGAGLTVIRDGGVIDCGGGNFRMAQYMTDNPTTVRLATNGLLRCNQVSIDTTKNTVATFLFDGGYLHPTVVNNSFAAAGNNAAWDRITFAVGPGGAGFEVEASAKNVWIYRPLVSGVAEGETDGGLMVRGPKGCAVCLMTNMTYNGATTIDGCTLQQRTGDNQVPPGTRLVLKNGGEMHMVNYQTDKSHSAATFVGIEGDGVLRGCTKVAATGTFAPSIGGKIEFDSMPQTISGTLSVIGDATGCGRLKFNALQDISTLSLSVPDISTFDIHAEKTLYKIVEGNYTDRFATVSGLGEDWAVSYRADGVYLSHIDAFTMIVR